MSQLVLVCFFIYFAFHFCEFTFYYSAPKAADATPEKPAAAAVSFSSRRKSKGNTII